MYASEIHHRCASMAKAHILEQQWSACDVSDQVLQLRERWFRTQTVFCAVKLRTFLGITRIPRQTTRVVWFPSYFYTMQKLMVENLQPLDEKVFVAGYGTGHVAQEKD